MYDAPPVPKTLNTLAIPCQKKNYKFCLFIVHWNLLGFPISINHEIFSTFPTLKKDKQNQKHSYTLHCGSPLKICHTIIWFNPRWLSNNNNKTQTALVVNHTLHILNISIRLQTNSTAGNFYKSHVTTYLRISSVVRHVSDMNDFWGNWIKSRLWNI